MPFRAHPCFVVRMGFFVADKLLVVMFSIFSLYRSFKAIFVKIRSGRHYFSAGKRGSY